MSKYTLDEIGEIVQHNSDILRALLKSKITNKEEKLMSAVKKEGTITVLKVMSLLNISKTHALNLMKKIGVMDGFQFIVGNKVLKRGSLLIFKASKKIQDQNKKLLNLFEKTKQVKYALIMGLFQIDLNDAKLLAKRFIETYKGFKEFEMGIQKDEL
jgi:hypothetical protein